MVAACFFSIPPTRWSERVIELSRLVRVDGIRVPLTMLISLCLKEVRKRFDLVVSFADVMNDHHGGIYQACSWRYHGFRKASPDGCMVNGVFVPARTCYGRYGTRSIKKLKETMIDVEYHWNEGKHLYWKALTDEGWDKADRLQLESNDYPKPKSTPKTSS